MSLPQLKTHFVIDSQSITGKYNTDIVLCCTFMLNRTIFKGAQREF